MPLVLHAFLSTSPVHRPGKIRPPPTKTSIILFLKLEISGLSNKRHVINAISVFMNRAAGLCVSVFNFTRWGAMSVATFIIRSHGVPTTS